MDVGHRLHPAVLAELRSRGRDHVIAAIAAEQHGVVSCAQLLEAGVGRGAIHTRIRRGQLLPLYRGVYAVGHTALAPAARDLAALLACGAGGVISHRSATVRWRMLPPNEARPIDVTQPRGAGRSRPGITVHRTRCLTQPEVRVLDGIPVTSPYRTLVDAAEDLQPRELESAYGEALVRRLVTEQGVRRTLRASAGRRGVGPLARLLDQQSGPSLTRSEAEERLLALVREAGFPPPRVNVMVRGHLLDFFWPDEGVVAEVDGYRYHSSRRAFERDHARDADLDEADLRVIRVTWRQLVDTPYAVVARLARGLAAKRRAA